jgi:hypothetical protein
MISTETRLDSLVVNGTNLLQYHEHVLKGLENIISRPLNEAWNDIFAFNVSLQQLEFGKDNASYHCSNHVYRTMLLTIVCTPRPRVHTTQSVPTTLSLRIFLRNNFPFLKQV